MQKRKIGIIISMLLVGLFILSSCTSKTPTGNAVKTTGQVKEFTLTSFTEVVDGKYFPQFSLKEITVNKGDTVRLKITNTKGVHDFKIDEFNVYAMTPLNQEVTVEFVADKEGLFEYYCTQPGHRQNGHWGTLNVLG
jgi:nitrite reductase (NO-forming)